MKASSSSDNIEMFRPPINRLMKVLDRSFFQKKIPISAARIFDKKHIAKCRTELSKDALQLDRLLLIRPVPESESRGAKDMLLKPEIDPEGECLEAGAEDLLLTFRCRHIYVE